MQQDNRPTIFHFYNRVFFANPDIGALNVPGFRQLMLPEEILSADCLVIHLPSVLLANEVEPIFNLREIVPESQIWIAESMESAANNPAMDDANFMSLFDIEMTYRQSSDVWIPYTPAQLAQEYQLQPIKARRKMCCAFVSSRFNHSERQEYMAALFKLVAVDSYGKFMRNKRLLIDRGASSKHRVMKKYTYTLAFENSIATDYVTEKFYEPLMVGSIPIYLGAPNIDEFAPGENCFINVADFSGPAELAEFLKTADPANFHTWRQQELRATYKQQLQRLQRPSKDRLAVLLIDQMQRKKC